MQLSYDLHVHPGPSVVPRWGTGAEIQAAAARAGVRGFVWKSHEGHTALECRKLSPTPRAIGSASLNQWATAESVAAAIADGARWLWGPTYKDGKVGWDLPLPAFWPAVADLLRRGKAPLILGTGHMDANGRRAFAELASDLPNLVCSITHSLYLEPAEIAMLRDLGAVFEVDLYTGTHPLPGRPEVDLATGIAALRALGATVYLTTDAGQRDTGDPYVFSASVLASLTPALGEGVLREIAAANPEKMAAHALEGLPV